MMSGNELQYSLIGLGILAILGLVIYNLWQERKARKHAEQAFRSNHHDVLLDGDVEPVIPPAPGGRMEPGLRPLQSDPAPAIPLPVKPVRSSQSSQRVQEPVLGFEDQAIDCAVSIEAPAGVSAAALFSAAQEVLAGVTRRLQWYGWSDLDSNWFLIDARTPGSINRACVTLQLVDRRGSVSESELDRFYQQLQRVCEQFLAVPRLPARTEVLGHAEEIDRFCSEVDVQIAVNVIAQKTSFAGTKLRGLAEAAGLQLGTDGTYHALDEAGKTLFVLANQESVPFSGEQLRHLQTHGLSLVLDMPRVAAPVLAFDRMVTLAQHLADSLDGAVVDDNRSALSDRSIGLIRSQLAQFELQMERQSMPAGGEIALRLFA
ncbi:cell division protein ZipA C-terminal FtsZ-binding domain-containing protein [Uliginosibacterium sp. 31-16]|uniref:cell division protein ZipA C-terminal FtsZ-binding domain-containing protein n=1 Tax=Uliginosibacterium sp. 31-16 TaxID=3068315 RepID=UPI00273F289B|nr:cell division protein ZipA C-terminal FtsZ-binding domain-containing protein [Uliginosibacterium sp. 31-16]MDP5239518.1 cell division protein ZipA C-terminal FtsZ-binding domain-containing protein [Uliginosibacterium sp. 31-16]